MIMASPLVHTDADGAAISSEEEEVAIVHQPEDDGGYVELVDEDLGETHTPLLSEPDENDVEDWSPEPVARSRSPHRQRSRRVEEVPPWRRAGMPLHRTAESV